MNIPQAFVSYCVCVNCNDFDCELLSKGFIGESTWGAVLVLWIATSVLRYEFVVNYSLSLSLSLFIHDESKWIFRFGSDWAEAFGAFVSGLQQLREEIRDGCELTENFIADKNANIFVDSICGWSSPVTNLVLCDIPRSSVPLNMCGWMMDWVDRLATRAVDGPVLTQPQQLPQQFSNTHFTLKRRENLNIII